MWVVVVIILDSISYQSQNSFNIWPRIDAHIIALVKSRVTRIGSSQFNGTSQAFGTTLKRDYVRVNLLQNAKVVLKFT